MRYLAPFLKKLFRRSHYITRSIVYIKKDTENTYNIWYSVNPRPTFQPEKPMNKIYRRHLHAAKASIRSMAASLLIIVASLLPATTLAVSPYPTLEAKAGRFFNYEEWASAAAMFDLMLEERPTVASTYGRAIVANGMLNQQQEQTRLTAMALDNHIPFDTIFSNVREWSYHIGQPKLFENYLLANRSAHPWMQRTINGYLLKYYAFRNNGARMTEYARIMLEGAPDNISFLTTLADGLMLTGDYTEGIATYRHILELDPYNYSTLLILGNWYAGHTPDSDSAEQSILPDKRKAIDYLSRAESLHPTPYVTALLEKLKK